MLRTALCCTALFIALDGAAWAQEPVTGDGALLGGMSIVGNDEAPKSLIIVPWKTSSLGDALDISRILGAGREPVDRDVFVRELNYYAIREGSSSGLESDSQ